MCILFTVFGGYLKVVKWADRLEGNNINSRSIMAMVSASFMILFPHSFHYISEVGKRKGGPEGGSRVRAEAKLQIAKVAQVFFV